MYFPSLFRFLRDADLDWWRQKMKSEKNSHNGRRIWLGRRASGEAFGVVHLEFMKRKLGLERGSNPLQPKPTNEGVSETQNRRTKAK